MTTEDDDGSVVQQVVQLSEVSAHLKKDLSELEARLDQLSKNDLDLNIRSSHLRDSAQNAMAYALHLLQ